MEHQISIAGVSVSIKEQTWDPAKSTVQCWLAGYHLG